MESGAILSECQTYRYLLWRRWQPEKRQLVFIMLNPSTASHLNDDPTIRRCMRFAGARGYGGIIVANLFAYRATDPAELPGTNLAIGPDNDRHLRALAERIRAGAALDVVFAWGTLGTYLNRDQAVTPLFPKAYCLGRTKGNHPRHPLYVPAAVEFISFHSADV